MDRYALGSRAAGCGSAMAVDAYDSDRTAPRSLENARTRPTVQGKLRRNWPLAAPNATVFPVAKGVNFRDHALDR